MTAKKALTTQAVTQENLLPMLNREILPVLRQVVKGTTITGSRASMTATELQFLAILANAGIVTDGTTA